MEEPAKAHLPAPAAGEAQDPNAQPASTRLNMKQAEKLLKKLSKVKTWGNVAKQEPGAGQERKLRVEIDRLEQSIKNSRPEEFSFEDKETLEAYYNGWMNRKKKLTWRTKQKLLQASMEKGMRGLVLLHITTAIMRNLLQRYCFPFFFDSSSK